MRLRTVFPVVLCLCAAWPLSVSGAASRRGPRVTDKVGAAVCRVSSFDEQLCARARNLHVRAHRRSDRRRDGATNGNTGPSLFTESSRMCETGQNTRTRTAAHVSVRTRLNVSLQPRSQKRKRHNVLVLFHLFWLGSARETGYTEADPPSPQLNPT